MQTQQRPESSSSESSSSDGTDEDNEDQAENLDFDGEADNEEHKQETKYQIDSLE